MELTESPRLQAIADGKSSSRVMRAADDFYEFDTEDPYDCAGMYQSGLESGLALAALAAKTPGDKVFKVTFGVYGDDDGLAFFVGTEDEIAEQLKALPEGDDGDGDEEGDEEDDE